MASALSSPLLGTGPKSRHTGSALAEPPPRTPPTPSSERTPATAGAPRQWGQRPDAGASRRICFSRPSPTTKMGAPGSCFSRPLATTKMGAPGQLLFAPFTHHETGCPRAVAFRALHPPRNWVPPGSCFSRPSPTTKLGAPGPSPLGTGDRTNPTQEAFYPGHERGAHPVGGSQPHVARPTWRRSRVAG
jgi:hypothetical protein